MSSVGPQLPPSLLEKRKRDDDGSDGSDSDSDAGPAPPPISDEIPPKKPRVMGPTMPTTASKTNLVQSPEKNPSDQDSSSEDDDFGPRLPSASAAAEPSRATTAQTSLNHAASDERVPSKRDDWMMVPPSGGDWSARVDPTKLKNRKFNTGKGAKGPPVAGNASDTWHETPAEKQARLQREMMGIKDKASVPEKERIQNTDRFDEETAKRMQEYNKSRGPTLYQSHQSNKEREEDDDPSARAFDREKDIGGGLQINSTKRRDMMKKASDFGSRFSSARYL